MPFHTTPCDDGTSLLEQTPQHPRRLLVYLHALVEQVARRLVAASTRESPFAISSRVFASIPMSMGCASGLIDFFASFMGNSKFE